MKAPAVLLLAALVMTTPAIAAAHAHESSHPPCGVAAGGLPDPAVTQACLASRYQPPKPKPAARSSSAPAEPAAPPPAAPSQSGH